MKVLFSALFATCVFASLHAQKTEIKFGEVSMEELNMKAYDKDPSATAVILFDKGETFLDDDLRVQFRRHTRIKFFNSDAFNTWANETVLLTHGEESIAKLKGATYNLENGKVATSEMQDESVFKSKVDRYLDQVKFSLPNVKEGAVVEYSYTINTAAGLLPSWQFQYTIPAVRSEYQTSIPNTFTFRKQLQGFLYMSNHETRNDGRIEKWTIDDVPAFKEEPFMTTPDDYVSKIDFSLTQLFIPGRPLIDFTTTWRSIGKNMAEQSDFGLVIKGSGFLRKIVEEITVGHDTPEKKLEAIYNYVKKNVEWNDQTDKIPDHALKKVLEDKKGSSSEINVLLITMLQKADIDAQAVLISTRAHGMIRPTPNFVQFNDVICLVKIGEKKMLIDGTDRNLPMTSLPKRCLNGSGLIISKEGSDWIPITTGKSRTVVGGEFKINSSGELTGKLNIARDGHAGGSMRESYLDLGKEKYLTESFGKKSWEIAKSDFVNVDNPKESVKELHDLVIRDHAQVSGDMIYLNPYVMGRMEENPFKSEERKYPVDFSSPFEHFYVVKIELSDDLVVEELPKPKVMMMPENQGRFAYNVTQSGNTINFVSQFTINKSVFLMDNYPTLRELYNQVIAKQAEQIVLKKKQ